MNIVIRKLDKTTYTLTLTTDPTVIDLKTAVGIKEGITENKEVKLVFGGKMLNDDNDKLSKYEIVDNSQIVAMVKDKKKQPANPITIATTVSAAHPVNPTPATQPNNQNGDQPINLFDEAHAQGGNDFGRGNLGIGREQLEAMYDQMQNDPQAKEEFAQVVRQIFQQSGREMSNEQIEQLLNNKELFLGMLQPRPTNGIKIEMTEQQAHDVNDLMALGFSKLDAYQTLAACDFNKEAAANILYQNMLEDRLEGDEPNQNQFAAQNPNANLTQNPNINDNASQNTQSTNTFTETELADINEIVQMGFSKPQVVEAYIVSSKNKEFALNYLLNNT